MSQHLRDYCKNKNFHSAGWRCFGRLFWSTTDKCRAFWQDQHETSSSKEGKTARPRKVVLTIQSLCTDIKQISSAVKIPPSPLLFSSMKKSAAYTAAEGLFIYPGWSHPERNKPHNSFFLQSLQHGESRGLKKGADFDVDEGFEAKKKMASFLEKEIHSQAWFS